MPKSTQTLPAPLVHAAKRFEKWRKTRTKAKIPDPLWDLAVRLARRYGLNRTATALRLAYYDLKRRAEATSSSSRGSETTPRFVEVVTTPPSPESACLVELEDPRGVKMRIHLKAAGAPELAALSHLFWRNDA
jgi:hypothetical protein